MGDAVATPGFRLPARWVVHTVGPNRHRGQTDPVLLSSCFARPLELAVGLGASSIAFPAVSAGVYGWAVEDVARIAVGTVRVWQEGRVAAGGARAARASSWCGSCSSRRPRSTPSGRELDRA